MATRTPENVMAHLRPSELSYAELSDEIDWRIANRDEDSGRFHALYREFERRCS